MSIDDEDLLDELRHALGSDTHAASDAAPSAAAGPPSLDRYRILGVLGAGGMGTVYEAEQIAPRRRVAIKVLGSSLRGERALRRFATETELLARLDHPSIARILEAGRYDASDGPRPYFVMELVLGRPILDDARERGLDVPERLRLVAQTADAIHHAHQKGVLHRDIKPANVLVDESGRPKVLDFGVARAMDRESLITRTTLPGQLVGTIASMSPEQAIGADVDTRSDVYALGVLLYELLTDRLPHDTDDKSVAALLREIETVEPKPLSAHRPALRGDLDAIAAKALAKDPAERYDSAAAFAADIRRHLADEPVSARLPSPTQRLGRFVRRNAALCAALASIGMLLVAGTIVTLLMAVRAIDAEAAARADQRRAEWVQAFLEDVLVQADPIESWTVPPTARDMLWSAAERLADGPAVDSAVEADLRLVLGRALLSLGAFEEAGAQLDRAWALHATGAAPDVEAESLMDALSTLAEIRGDDETAESLRRRAVEIARERGEDDSRLSAALGRLGGNLIRQGRLDEAEAILSEAASPGVAASAVPASRQIAMLHATRGRVDEAIGILRQLVETTRRVTGGQDASTAETLTLVSALLRERGDAAAAEDAAREALAIFAPRLAVDHPSVARAALELGLALRAQGRTDEAGDVLAEALAVQQRAPGIRPHVTAVPRMWLGVVRAAQGRAAEGEALLRAALSDLVGARGERHLDSIRARQHLSALLHATGRLPEALDVITPAVQAAREAHAGSRWLAKVASTRGWYLAASGRYADAELHFFEVRNLIETSGGALDDLRVLNLETLVKLYASWGRPEHAERWQDELHSDGGGAASERDPR